MTLTITNNKDNILFMGPHSVILEDMVVNNSNSNSKVDSRLAELYLGTGIWFGERSFMLTASHGIALKKSVPWI